MIKNILYKIFIFSSLTVSIACGVYASTYVSNLLVEEAIVVDIEPIIEEVEVKPEIKKRPICTVTDASKAYASCNEGDIILFTPASWGNEQYPVKVAAFLCNYDNPIVHTAGGVSCVFSPRG